MKQVVVILFLLVSNLLVGQDSTYCISFTKGKKSLSVKEGKNINYIVDNDSIWKKGEIFRITSDSISIEHYKESNLFAEGENTFTLTYHLNEIRAIAYKRPETVAKGTAVATASAIVIIATLGAMAEEVHPDDSFKRYNKILDTEVGWKFDIVECKNN